MTAPLSALLELQGRARLVGPGWTHAADRGAMPSATTGAIPHIAGLLSHGTIGYQHLVQLAKRTAF